MELAVSSFPHIFNHREFDLPTRVCFSAWQRDCSNSVVVAESSEIGRVKVGRA